MITIGVISDTHGYLDPRAYAALADCDAIIHAGDICDPAIIRELETLAPVHAVRGNNDADEYGASVSFWAKPVIGEVKFLVSHYPEEVDLSGYGLRHLDAGETLPAVCIHGHTHTPRLESDAFALPAQLVMNPGSATRPRRGNPPSIGRIFIEDGRVAGAQVEGLDGEILLSC